MGKEGRLQYVDAIKGFAVLWIVFYHLIAACAFKTYVLNPFMELFLVIFFFFSGYFFNPNKGRIGQSIWKRAKTLLIPFFAYSLFFWAAGTIYLLATNQAPFIETLGCLRNFYVGCIWNRDIQNWLQLDYYHLGKRYLFLADFWFLIALLFSSVIFFLIIKLVLKKVPFTIAAIILLFALTGVCAGFNFTLPYNLHMVPYWTAFMVLGALAGNKKLLELPALKRAPKYIIGVAALAIGAVVAVLKEPSLNQYRGSFGGENQLVSMLLSIAAAAPFIWGIGMLFYQLEQDGLRLKEISWFGSHSLIFYLFHMFYAWLISIIFRFDVLKMELWLSVIIAFSVIAICIIHCLLQDLIKGKIAQHKQKKAALKEG